MQTFLLNLLIKAVENDKIRAFLLQLAERIATTLVPMLLPKLASIIPAAVGAGIKGLGDIIPDIHLPELPDVVETIRTDVNKVLPEGIDIPVVSDAFRNITGLDLSDILLGQHH